MNARGKAVKWKLKKYSQVHLTSWITKEWNTINTLFTYDQYIVTKVMVFIYEIVVPDCKLRSNWNYELIGEWSTKDHGHKSVVVNSQKEHPHEVYFEQKFQLLLFVFWRIFGCGAIRKFNYFYWALIYISVCQKTLFPYFPGFSFFKIDENTRL